MVGDIRKCLGDSYKIRKEGGDKTDQKTDASKTLFGR